MDLPDSDWGDFSCWHVVDSSILYLDVLQMEKGLAYGGLPFSGIVCPVPDVGINYLVWND